MRSPQPGSAGGLPVAVKYLLDTRTLLWSIGQSQRLSSKARALIQDGANDVGISIVSLWEISLKHGIGKLVLGSMAPDDVPSHCERLGFAVIDVTATDASTYHMLPRPTDHRDPFDRMLAHQCIRRGAALVSRDTRLSLHEPYGLVRIW